MKTSSCRTNHLLAEQLELGSPILGSCTVAAPSSRNQECCLRVNACEEFFFSIVIFFCQGRHASAAAKANFRIMGCADRLVSDFSE